MPAQPSFRRAASPALPVHGYGCPEDILEAMLQSLQDGAVHRRPPLPAVAGTPLLRFIEIGLALRACVQDAARHAYLVARLLPHRALMVGALPVNLQPRGMLPALAPEEQEAHGFRALEQIDDAELRDWVIADCGMIYGELERHELDNYFDVIAPHLRPGGVMFDLGSGLGKVVLSAALSLPFARCVGVELLPYRHRLASRRRQALLEQVGAALAALPQPLRRGHTLRLPNGQSAPAAHLLDLADRIELLESDMFDADLRQASLVFLYSTCFGPLMGALADKLARELPEHSLVSTTTYPLQHPAFRLIENFGPDSAAWTSLFLYQRLGPPGPWPPSAVPDLHVPDAAEWSASLHALLSSMQAVQA